MRDGERRGVVAWSLAHEVNVSKNRGKQRRKGISESAEERAHVRMSFFSVITGCWTDREAERIQMMVALKRQPPNVILRKNVIAYSVTGQKVPDNSHRAG